MTEMDTKLTDSEVTIARFDDCINDRRISITDTCTRSGYSRTYIYSIRDAVDSRENITKSMLIAMKNFCLAAVKKKQTDAY